jgi:hypothetical protein
MMLKSPFSVPIKMMLKFLFWSNARKVAAGGGDVKVAMTYERYHEISEAKERPCNYEIKNNLRR